MAQVVLVLLRPTQAGWRCGEGGLAGAALEARLSGKVD